MPLYPKYLEFLNVPKEKREAIINSNPQLKKLWDQIKQKEQPSIKLDESLTKKFSKSPLEELIIAYFSLKQDPLNITKIGGLGALRKAQYKKEVQKLLEGENDPAKFFSNLGQVCEHVKQEIAYVIGEILIKERGRKTEEYIQTGLEYLEGIK